MITTPTRWKTLIDIQLYIQKNKKVKVNHHLKEQNNND